MSQSFQKEKPPARVNLFLEVQKGDAQQKMELPLRTLVLGDFEGKESGVPLEDREKVNINKDNFEAVMRSSDLGVDMTVPDKLRGGDEEMKVSLKIEGMQSFSPEEVAKQVPELQRLLATRNLLQDLRNRLVSVADFRKQLESIIKDPEALATLHEELNRVVKDEPSTPAS